MDQLALASLGELVNVSCLRNRTFPDIDGACEHRRSKDSSLSSKKGYSYQTTATKPQLEGGKCHEVLDQHIVYPAEDRFWLHLRVVTS